MILVPKYRDIVVASRMPKPRVQGFYKLDAMGPDGRVRPLTGWFPNLITNAGLDRLGIGGDQMALVAVGTGNTAPAFGDTQLVSLVASTSSIFSSNSTVQGSAPYYATATKQWQFAQGAAAGNLAEVGVGPSTTNLFSRALILDGLGAPTTITILPIEFLNVTYQLRMYPPTGDVTGSVVLDGVSYNYTIRASNVTNSGNLYGWNLINVQPGNIVDPQAYIGQTRLFTGAINASITGQPAGSSNVSGFRSNIAAYSNGTYHRTSTWTWGINDGNISISSVQVAMGAYQPIGSSQQPGGRGCFQCGFSAPIPKDNTKQLTLDFDLAWARV